jgi:hypothetical protein
MSTITKAQYDQDYRNYVAAEIKNITIPQGSASNINFWIAMHGQWKEQFDASLASQGITVNG